MNQQQLMKMKPEERVVYVNELLKKETTDHLKNVAQKHGISPSKFSKIMREGNYQYHQAEKEYYKLLTLEEYKSMMSRTTSHSDDLIDFLNAHQDELKKLLEYTKTQPIIDPEVYDPKSKTQVKSIQINSDIYERFTTLQSTKFPHFRLNMLFSQCLLEFIKKYE